MGSRLLRILISTSLLAATSGASLAVDSSPESPSEHPFAIRCREAESIPTGLLEAYAGFVQAAKTHGAVESYLLPHSVDVSRTPRSPNDVEVNDNIDLLFLKERFKADILSFRKDPDDSYLVRTATTAIWFVQTKSGSWRIYRYYDKPIK